MVMAYTCSGIERTVAQKRAPGDKLSPCNGTFLYAFLFKVFIATPSSSRILAELG